MKDRVGYTSRKGRTMGEKDKSEKLLEDYADVFTDIINVLAFQGNRLLREEDIVSGPTESIYKADTGELHSQFRDVVKYDKKGKTLFSVIGLENQSTVDRDMIFRIMKYDAMSYQGQIDREEEERRPVISIVLYFGITPWNGPKCLTEALKTDDIPYKEYLPQFQSDIKLNLIEVAFLPEEIREQLTSDFRIVADYFCAVREGRELEFRNDQREFRHVAELMEFFRIFTKDPRYEEYLPGVVERAKKGEKINMCTLLEYAEQKGLEQGIEKGIEQGKLESQKEIALSLLDAGMPYQQVIKIVKISEAALKEWQREREAKKKE